MKNRRKGSIIFLFLAQVAIVKTTAATVLAEKQLQKLNEPSTSSVEITSADRQREAEWLNKLGVTPHADYLLKKPFEAPYSGQSFMVPTTWFKDYQPPATLTAEQVLADLEFMHFYLAKGYGAYEKRTSQGHDWYAFFATWEKRLKSLDQKQLFPAELLFKDFYDFQAQFIDNHTLLYLQTYNSARSQTATFSTSQKVNGDCTLLKNNLGVTYPLNPNDPAHVPVPTISYDPQAGFKPEFMLRFPHLWGTITALQCNGQWINVKLTPEETRASIIQSFSSLTTQWKFEDGDLPRFAFLDENETVAYLRLPTFQSLENAKIIADFKSWIPTSSQNSKTLVVDLRFNGGGGGSNDAKAISHILDNASQTLRLSYDKLYMKNSCLTQALFWGQTQNLGLRQINEKSDMMFTPEQLEKALEKQTTLSFDHECKTQFSQPFSTPGVNWKPYKDRIFPSKVPVDGKRIVILTNNHCGSDCEGMVHGLRDIPGSTVVGVNTAGVSEFIQPGYLFLPHSRVIMSIAQGYSDIYGDARSVDGYGLDVDILIKEPSAYTKADILHIVKGIEILEGL